MPLALGTNITWRWKPGIIINVLSSRQKLLKIHYRLYVRTDARPLLTTLLSVNCIPPTKTWNLYAACACTSGKKNNEKPKVHIYGWQRWAAAPRQWLSIQYSRRNNQTNGSNRRVKVESFLLLRGSTCLQQHNYSSHETDFPPEVQWNTFTAVSNLGVSRRLLFQRS